MKNDCGHFPIHLGDNCIKNFHLGRYKRSEIQFYGQRARGAVKRDFQTYIQKYTSPSENFEYSYPLNV